MLHIAENDGFCPPQAQTKIKEALGPNDHVTIHSYPGVDHAFARIGGANYNAQAANTANERSAAFLAANLK